MRLSRLMNTVAAAMIVLTATSCSDKATKQQRVEARSRLQTLLASADSGTVISLVVGDTLRLSRATIDFYKKRRFKPVWSAGDRLTDQGQKLAKVLSETTKDGLHPQRYRYDLAHKMITALAQDGDAALDDAAEAQYGADLDLLLTEGFTRYASDLARGTLDPSEGGLAWRIPRGGVPKENLLRAVSRREDPAAIVDQVRPNAPQYRRLMHVLSRLEDVKESGGWQPVQSSDSGSATVALRNRLIASEDQREAALAERGAQAANVFDADLRTALKHFQSRHGIEDDGALGAKTLEELNHSVDDRIAEVKLNLDRWRWLPHDLGKMYILVNVAGFEMQVVENGRAIEEMNVVVGQPGWETPIFADTLENIVVNPYWNVPESIMQDEILPAIAADPEYLERNNMERTSDGGVRQRPGPKNALGDFKFLFPNKDNIYLHDTPADQLFSLTSRAFSHGCIRLERPRDLAYLLGNKLARKTPEQIDRLSDMETEQWISLKRKIPVYILYFTTWVDDDGTIRYHHDVYGMNEGLEAQKAKFDQRTM